MEAATSTLERRVREIPPTRKPEELLRNYDGKMRVAAYCRVSTDSEEQLNSYEAQKTYYTQKIQDNPDWEMAGIYADEGISGTSLKKRAEFNKMITACKRGRIDFIITKSLSRFARNTVDCLDTVRLLKANGIGVYFEKENINTLTESSEFLVTLFSGFAQAESESLSKNVAWGKEKSAKAGNVHFQYKKMLGYRKGEDGQPEIMPEEAAIVRRIYRRYLDGCTLGKIKRELDEDGIPTAQGVECWSPAIIHNILTNEKYIGDGQYASQNKDVRNGKVAGGKSKPSGLDRAGTEGKAGMDGADKLSAPYNRAAPRWAAPLFPTVFAPVSRRVRFLQAPQGNHPHTGI